jgi:hypothetical protein
MVGEEIISGLKLASDAINNSDYAVVVVKNNQIICKKKGDGIKPFLAVIEELDEDIHGSIIGDKILGKASSLLCIYSQVQAVYSPQGTKTGIALLILCGILSQVDNMIPFIKNRSGDDICPFEKMLENIDSAEEAYNILKEKLL